MTNSVNWMLIIVGALALVAEVILGVVTGFDLAIVGISLMAGGGIGLAFGSAKVGLFAAGAFPPHARTLPRAPAGVLLCWRKNKRAWRSSCLSGRV